jgi:hypothetical protein
MPKNLTPNPFPSGKGNRIYKVLGAGVTPAQGGAEPTVGFACNRQSFTTRSPRVNSFVVAQAVREFAAGVQEAGGDFGGDSFGADAVGWAGYCY